MGSSRDPSAFLPLKAADFNILLSLADGDRHGYAMLKAIESSWRGRTRIAPSPFYRRIRRLLGHTLVAEADQRPAPELDDERRRYFTLTPLGRSVLAAEAARLVHLAGTERVRRLALEATTGGPGG
jgi:DNA-binding PadR family transcriptional regulator